MAFFPAPPAHLIFPLFFFPMLTYKTKQTLRFAMNWPAQKVEAMLCPIAFTNAGRGLLLLSLTQKQTALRGAAASKQPEGMKESLRDEFPFYIVSSQLYTLPQSRFDSGFKWCFPFPNTAAYIAVFRPKARNYDYCLFSVAIRITSQKNTAPRWQAPSSSLRPRRANSDIIRAFPILLSSDIDPKGGERSLWKVSFQRGENETRGPFQKPPAKVIKGALCSIWGRDFSQRRKILID